MFSITQTLSVYQYASLQEKEREIAREEKKICLQSKFPIQFIHIIHITSNARLVLRFHGFHRRFSHESRLVSVTHAVAFEFQPLSVCTCFILIFLCSLILHSCDHANRHLHIWRIVFFLNHHIPLLLLDALIISITKIGEVIYQCKFANLQILYMIN